MDIEEAYRAVRNYDYNLWNALARMELEWDELDLRDRQAYRLVKQKLQVAVEEAEQNKNV